MNVPVYSGNAIVALLVLLIFHTVITFGACRYFARPTVMLEFGSDHHAPIETTTPEQRARGESSFQMGSKTRLFSPIPIPVLLYVIAGYTALGLAAAVGLFAWIRQAD